MQGVPADDLRRAGVRMNAVAAPGELFSLADLRGRGASLQPTTPSSPNLP